MFFGTSRSYFTITACSFLYSMSAAYSQTDPCSTLADLQSKGESSLFVGYGAGSSQKEADQNAQVDLARNIRQKVTATSTVEETQNDATLQSTSKSVVSEILIGAKVLKRCPNGSDFSSVVTLEKNTFISSLTEKLSSNIKKANKFKSSIENAKSEEVLGQNIDSAKKFLADYQESSEADFELCKVYKGCSDLKIENSLHDLAELVSKEGDKDQYLLITDNDKVSAALRDDLITLLEADNIKIMDGSVSDNAKESKRRILASCKAKVGSKIPGTDDRVVETRCSVEAYIGKQKKFRKIYSCKATADSGISADDAVSSCSGRLQLE